MIVLIGKNVPRAQSIGVKKHAALCFGGRLQKHFRQLIRDTELLVRKSRGASDHWFLAIAYELNEPPKTGRKSAEGVPLLKNIEWQSPTENQYTIITLYQLAISSTSKKLIFSTSLFLSRIAGRFYFFSVTKISNT